MVEKQLYSENLDGSVNTPSGRQRHTACGGGQYRVYVSTGDMCGDGYVHDDIVRPAGTRSGGPLARRIYEAWAERE